MAMLYYVYAAAVVSTDLTFKTRKMVCGHRKHHSTCYEHVFKSLYHSDPEQQTFVVIAT